MSYFRRIAHRTKLILGKITHDITRKCKYIYFRTQGGGRIEDYFREKDLKDTMYYQLMEKWQKTTKEESKIGIGQELLSCRNYICKYANMVSDFSWEKHKIEEQKMLKKFFFEDNHIINGFEQEIKYLKEKNEMIAFPYSFRDDYYLKKDSIIVYPFDSKLKYIMHNNKKLFFPIGTDNYIREQYIQLLIEQDENSPHRYFREGQEPTEESVFVDVGAAEGIISLNYVEKVKKIIIFECSEKWINALEHTFEPWKEKVEIIRKFVGMQNESDITSIDTILNKEKISQQYVIKMDIEGMEFEALLGAEKTIRNNPCLISCATYHTNHIYEEIEYYLEEIGYKCEASIGVMLFIYGQMTLQNGKYEKIKYPYFRKGILRAWKQDNIG